MTMESKMENRMQQPQKVLELKKHVAVIHSSNKLTLLQRKIANALLFNAYGELQEKEEHVIHIATLCELIGYDSHDHKSIKQALVNLLSTVLEWNLVDGERLDSEGVWNASSIIADASIDRAICTYSYSNKMRKLLHRPNMYGRLDMLVQARFQSGYGLALYENCNRFQDIGQTPWFNMEKFRKLMGVKEGKYKIFRDFKTRVLDKAVEEVNKYSALVIYPQLRKQNRQVTAIQFLIKKSSTILLNDSNAAIPLEDEQLTDMLKSQFNFSTKQAAETIVQYDEKYIREKINLIQASPSFKNGKVKNLARYLLAALQDDYQPTKSSISINQNSDIVKVNHSSKLQDAEKLTAFKRFQDIQLVELFNALSQQEQHDIIKKFEKDLRGVYHEIYLREGIKQVLVRDQLCIFLRKINHGIVNLQITFEEWLMDKKG
jgi:plasmid replication initiation protein